MSNAAMSGPDTGSEAQPTLHLLNKAPSHPRFPVCLGSVGPEDHLLLIENAVVALTDNSVTLPPRTSAMMPDCQARGLADLVGSTMDLVTPAGMVALTDRFQRIISW
jgi:tRNA 2-thiouridine synthesizing protein B